eukprot:TRINITY_DN3598_c0_g6_i1.p1 TRINITY_DN3598_c0_g6~~TRINITY_DN3598_c0_g6_i1.p1  ORF type:complete len:279 (-),score=46.24 TRINITY_DN3598_c0_g6_i1:154-990(-)
METDTSNLEQYKVVPYTANTYGIGPSVEPNMETVHMREFWNTIALITFYVAIVIFVAAIHCRASEVIDGSWCWLLLPYSVALLPFGFFLFSYIRSQIGYTVASSFCIKVVIVGILTVCVTLQVYLIILRTDEVITVSYAVVFVPSYFCFTAPIIYFIIISPLCISCQPPFFYYGSIMIVYCVAICVSLYYIIQTQDFPDSGVSLRNIFYPLWVAAGLHLLWALIKLKEKFWTVIFLLFAALFSVMEYLNVDNKADIYWWIPALLFACAFAVPIFTFKY